MQIDIDINVGFTKFGGKKTRGKGLNNFVVINTNSLFLSPPPFIFKNHF